MLKYGDKVGIVACSNPLNQREQPQIELLTDSLISLGLKPILSEYIYGEQIQVKPEQRAAAINHLYADQAIRAIFDISGGDIANELLDYLDYPLLSKNYKPFFGYSDLTTVINAINTKTGNSLYLYQLRNIIWDNTGIQLENFRKSIYDSARDLFAIHWDFIRGSNIQGTVVGGNIRCLLKLAGTQYMPDFKNKVLFLESYGGNILQMRTYLSQLAQLGVFKDIKGLLLGTFTKLEAENEYGEFIEVILNQVNPNLPIAKTKEVGHGKDSKCLIIGKHIEVEDNSKL